MQGSAFSNAVFIACCNRTGEEPKLTFAGGSFVVDPAGEIIAKAGDNEELLIVDIDRTLVTANRNRRPFLRDRRPELYGVLTEE